MYLWVGIMKFWVSFGLVCGLAMIVVGAAVANNLLVNSDTIKLNAALGAVLLGVSASAYISSKTMRLTVLTFGSPIAVIALIAINGLPSHHQPVLAMSQVSAAVERGRDGHFRADAEINGTDSIEMLVDTGASVVLLSFEHAEKLNLTVANLNFDVPVITASGRSSVALVALETISVGGVTLKNIDAAVAKPGELHSSLLGMSYLGALQEVVLRGNEMILRN